MLADGVDTIVNLGAGLDTRPYRLELPHNLKWFEIDFPHMIQYKNQQLAVQKPRCQLTRIELDLTDRIALQCELAIINSVAKKVLARLRLRPTRRALRVDRWSPVLSV